MMVGYRFTKNLRLEANVFNMFNNRGYAAQYAYDYRLTPTSTESSGATGHPVEPVSARFTLTANF